MRRSVLITAITAGITAALFLASTRPAAYAHCEIPCGIYGDHMRVQQMLEDCDTIEKAVGQIQQLNGKTDALSMNQMMRWISNKEEHATRIQDTIAQYFMHQRIKPVERGSEGWADYVTKLTEHHAVMVNAMTTKQTVDPAAVASLRDSIRSISKYYPDHDHDHGGAGHSHGG